MLSPVQIEILKVYSEIQRICKKHNIRYFGIGGTAIGAVRHKGFIPWDDDMDLGIPIDDFIKFEKICKKELKPPFKYSPLNFFGAKIHNSSTTFLEAQCMTDIKNYYGAFVDIFPLIGAPSDSAEQKLFLDDMKSYYDKAFIFDRYPQSSSLKQSDIMARRKQICFAHPINHAERIVEFASGYWFTKNAKGLHSPVIMPFENSTIPVANTYNEDLTNQYGDYMKLPPKEQRYSHSEYSLVDMNTPYSTYYQKLEKLDPALHDLLLAKHKHEGMFYDNFLDISSKYQKLQQTYYELKHQNTTNENELKILRGRLHDIQENKLYKIYGKLRSVKSRLSSKSAN